MPTSRPLSRQCRMAVIISKMVIWCHLKGPNRHAAIIDGPSSLVTNIVATALTLMRASTPVRTDARVVAGSWKSSVISSSVTDGRSSAVLPLSLTTPTFPPLPVMCLYTRMSPEQRQQHFRTASCAQKAPVSGCSHCDIVSQMLQIRHIGYWSMVALSSTIVQITANVPIWYPITISVWH